MAAHRWRHHLPLRCRLHRDDRKHTRNIPVCVHTVTDEFPLWGGVRVTKVAFAESGLALTVRKPKSLIQKCPEITTKLSKKATLLCLLSRVCERGAVWKICCECTHKLACPQCTAKVKV